MKLQILLRKIHYWGSIIIAVPLLLMIGAGVLLMLKKEAEWIQPASTRGADASLPTLTVEQLFDVAKTAPEAVRWRWIDMKRVDFKPSKGMVKFVGPNDWEVQVDTSNGQILQVAYRRSDFIEALHDGSFFGDSVKLSLFLPAGIILFGLWGTGLYLFFQPRIVMRRKRKAKALAVQDFQHSTADKGSKVPAE